MIEKQETEIEFLLNVVRALALLRVILAISEELGLEQSEELKTPILRINEILKELEREVR